MPGSLTKLKALLLGAALAGPKLGNMKPVKNGNNNSRRRVNNTSVKVNGGRVKTNSGAVTAKTGSFVPSTARGRVSFVPNASLAMMNNRKPMSLLSLANNPSTFPQIQEMINVAKKNAIHTAKANLPPNHEREKVRNRFFKNNKMNNSGPYTFKNTVASLRRRLAHVRKSLAQHKTILIKTNRYGNVGKTLQGAQAEFAARKLNTDAMKEREESLARLGVLRTLLEKNAGALVQKLNNRGLMLKPSNNNVRTAGQQALRNLNRMHAEVVRELNATRQLRLNSANKSVNKPANNANTRVVTSGFVPNRFVLQAQTFVALIDKVPYLSREESKLIGGLEKQIQGLVIASDTAEKTSKKYLMAQVKSAISITLSSSIPTDMLDLSERDLAFTKAYVNSTLERPEVLKVIQYLSPGWIVPDEDGNCLLAAIAYSMCGALCPTQEKFMKTKQFLFNTSAVMWSHGKNNTWYSRDIGTALVILKVGSLSGPMAIRAVSKLLLSIPMTPVRVARWTVRQSVRNSFIGSLVPIILFSAVVAKAGGILDTILYALDLTLLFYAKLNT
jgi:hypothetical protein